MSYVPFGIAAGAAASVDASDNGFRLSLTTAVPVTTTDVTGASTLYLTPYRSNRIALYGSGSLPALMTSTEKSIVLSGLTSGKPYDVFAYNNAGTLALELLVWTNDTTRATGLTDTGGGVFTKTGDVTRRWVGTIYTTGTTTTEDSDANRYVFNATIDNRVARKLKVVEATNTWTYSTATWRSVNGSSANSVNYVGDAATFVAIEAQLMSDCLAGTVATATGIGIDSTSANSADIFGYYTTVATAMQRAAYRGYPGLGKHTINWLEIANGSGTEHFFGDNNNPTQVQSGMVGQILA